MEQRVVKPPNSKVQRPERWPESFLKELYANYRRTGQPSTKRWDMDSSLLSKVGGKRITREQVPGCSWEQIIISHPALDKYGIEAYEQAHQIMEQRGWVTLEKLEDTITLTPAGIDHARWVGRPWYIKMWDFMKGDVRAILVAAITAIIMAVVTALVLRSLGWG